MTTKPSTLTVSAAPVDQQEPLMDQKIKKLSELFSLLGADPEQNIHSIVEQTCHVIEGAHALYQRLDSEKGALVCRSGCNLPADFPKEEIAEGHICFEATIKGGNQPVVIGDLDLTPYAQSDSYVRRYGLKSYLGSPVRGKGHVVGALCVVDTRKREFSSLDTYIIITLAKAISIEEERKQAEADLKSSEARYRDLYLNTPVMLYSLDHEDRITNVSNHWLQSMGYDRNEVIGRSVFDFFAPQSRKDAINSSFPEFYMTGQIKDHPYQFATKNGQLMDVQLSAIAQRDSKGNYTGAMAFMVDVTQAKVSEKKEIQLTARLQQAQKMEAIATLAGGIAHQFNNALAVILGNLELIQMDGLADKRIFRFIDPVSQAGQKMVHLTSQLLAYARGGKFQTQVVSSHRFVRETMGLISHSLASYVELSLDLDEDADPIEVDSTQMQMLLSAVLSNASEAIDKKGKVTVRLCNIEVTSEQSQHLRGLKSGRYVLLQITDTGKGMDEQVCERIFEPFFTTKFQGRGLGMAAVYGIVKKHGGHVYVASQPEKGTTVSIYLPGAHLAKQVMEVQPSYSVQGTGTALIVEDEHLVMDVNRTIVEKLGYRVLEAKSGREALEHAKNYEGQIDFVLLDVILPDMGGNQIYPKLKELRPNIKVIVCSGFTLDGPAREILDAGAECFLPKPFTVAALAAELDEIFKKK